MSIRLLKTCQTCTDKNVILWGVNIAIPSEGILRGQECHSTRRKNDRERPILPKKGRQKTRPLHYMLNKKGKKGVERTARINGLPLFVVCFVGERVETVLTLSATCPCLVVVSLDLDQQV